MKTFIVRPYFGHDCDSESGFNNGHYMDEIEVSVSDESDAMDKAMELVKAEFLTDPSEWSNESHMGEDVLYSEFGHAWFDSEGNEYSSEDDLPLDPDTEEPIEAEYHYRYQYIDFSDVKEGTLPDESDKPLTPFFVHKPKAVGGSK